MFKDSRGISHYSFAESCPDQMLDWDYDKNTADPYSLPKTSKEVCCFKCHICGYEWKSGIYRISYSRSKCLYCYGKQIPKIGISDLFTLRPDLKDDWDWSKNTKDPKCLGINSHYFAHWKCHVCGHEWCCRLDTRSRNGSGCPVCAHVGDLDKDMNYLVSRYGNIFSVESAIKSGGSGGVPAPYVIAKVIPFDVYFNNTDVQHYVDVLLNKYKCFLKADMQNNCFYLC